MHPPGAAIDAMVVRMEGGRRGGGGAAAAIDASSRRRDHAAQWSFEWAHYKTPALVGQALALHLTLAQALVVPPLLGFSLFGPRGSTKAYQGLVGALVTKSQIHRKTCNLDSNLIIKV